MEELNWKSIGWLVTKKLVYYFLALTVLSVLAGYALSCMTVASTLSFIGGGVLFFVVIGVFITLLVREVLFYINKFNK